MCEIIHVVFLYNSPMRAYFVRHGESEANVLNVISNRGSIHGLTEKGRGQAYLLADRLKEAQVAYIYCSPLLRAVETADVLATTFGLNCTVSEGLREFDCGELEGRGDLEAWNKFRDLVRMWLVVGDLEARLPGGESYLDIRTRFFAMIDDEINSLDPAQGSVMLVGHGMVFYLMLPLLFSNINYEFARGHSIGNTATATAEKSEVGWNCHEWFGKVPPEQSPGAK